jgi:hypothetical protein
MVQGRQEGAQYKMKLPSGSPAVGGEFHSIIDFETVSSSIASSTI